MGVGSGSYLGQVRHNQHLMVAAECRKRITDRLSCFATNPGVNFVEN